MTLTVSIALKHLLARKRQSIVSLSGIVLGVAFFLAISGLMQGSEKDFLKRLVDNAPHINIVDEFREPRLQPVFQYQAKGAVELKRVKPVNETRGIRGYEQVLDYIRSIPGVQASPVLAGQALLSFAGRDFAIAMNGMIPEEIKAVSTIDDYMVEGDIDALIGNPDGIVIGQPLAKKLSLGMNETITVATTTGQVRNFKVLGLFRTGRSSYDESAAFVDLKRVQAMLNRPNRANSIIMKIPDPYAARDVAAGIEQHIGYKSISWQESSEDIMNTLSIRNTIMYTVVSAVLVVAAFGIYNVISTVVLEKQRDISILKSMGFTGSDVQRVFLTQGVLLGVAGSLLGVPLGCLIMAGMMQIKFKPPGGSEVVSMPVDWGLTQFLVAGGFAIVAAVLAAYLPSRKAAKVQPVDILRGGM